MYFHDPLPEPPYDETTPYDSIEDSPEYWAFVDWLDSLAEPDWLDDYFNIQAESLT